MNKILLTAAILYSIQCSSQSIVELGFFSPLISTFDMKYKNDHLLITQQGLKVFDVSNPSNPVQTGSATYPGNYAYQIAIEDNYAYMAEGGNGAFAIYDISNINSPFFTGSINIPSTEFVTGGDLLVKDFIAYLTSVDSLHILDISNPNSPSIITSLQVDTLAFGTSSSLAADSTFLFVLHSSGIGVYDVSNPTLPLLVSTIPLTHTYHNGLAIDTIGHRLFSPWVSSLQTYTGYDSYDISNANLPVPLFSDSTTFGGGEFGVTDYFDNLLIVSQGGGVNLFDVSSGFHGLVYSFSGQNVPNSSVSIEFRDSVFYNARRGGFEILKVTGGFPTNVDASYGDMISIHPNPIFINSSMTISGFEESNKNIQLLNPQGKVVFERIIPKGESHLYIPELPDGIYFLSVSADEFKIVKKLIVTN